MMSHTLLTKVWSEHRRLKSQYLSTFTNSTLVHLLTVPVNEGLERALHGGTLEHHKHVAVQNDLHDEHPDDRRQGGGHCAFEEESVVEQCLVQYEEDVMPV